MAAKPNLPAVIVTRNPQTQSKDTFPGVSRSPKELRKSIIEKYQDILPFPTS